MKFIVWRVRAQVALRLRLGWGEQGQAVLAPVLARSGEIVVPARDQPQMRRAALLVAVVPRVESAKHRHGELVVVAMALGDDHAVLVDALDDAVHGPREGLVGEPRPRQDRKSTRLNSSH